MILTVGRVISDARSFYAPELRGDVGSQACDTRGST